MSECENNEHPFRKSSLAALIGEQFQFQCYFLFVDQIV